MEYSLAWITDSERIVSAAYWTAIICLIGSVLLILLVVLLRLAWLDDERRRKRFLKKWRPILEASARGSLPRKFPFLYRGNRLYLLEYWNSLHDGADRIVQENLNKVGRQLRLAEIAKALIHSKYLWRQLLGITTLGNLREDSAWNELHHLAESDDTVVSLTAARALVQLRPKEAGAFIIPRIVKQQGWAPARVASLLVEAGEGSVCGPLTEALRSGSDEEKMRLIHYVGVTRCPGASEEVRSILRAHMHDRDLKGEETLITESLKILDDPADIELARPYLGHPNWHIRVQAVNALGRIGNMDDVKRLVILLKDEHWWVRYRAAQALIKLYGNRQEGIDRILAEHPEPATQEILRHVMAEKRFA